MEKLCLIPSNNETLTTAEGNGGLASRSRLLRHRGHLIRLIRDLPPLTSSESQARQHRPGLSNVIKQGVLFSERRTPFGVEALWPAVSHV